MNREPTEWVVNGLFSSVGKVNGKSSKAYFRHSQRGIMVVLVSVSQDHGQLLELSLKINDSIHINTSEKFFSLSGEVGWAILQNPSGRFEVGLLKKGLKMFVCENRSPKGLRGKHPPNN